jgi:ribosomal RNA-processing protein 36
MDAHKTELRTLRDNLKAARKLLTSSPRDLRPEREAEVRRLEMAVKRAESMVNKDRRAKVDQEALTKLNETERAKRKEGKAGWWMKECMFILFTERRR